MMLVPVTDIDVSGKRVLVRVDFNVPLKDGIVLDDTRIKGAIPTISYLLQNNARIILCSHLGRPGGVRNEELSLLPVGIHLQELLNEPVNFIDSFDMDEVTNNINESGAKINLLENTRFHPGEKTNDEEFSKQLASLADIFVSDAFGAVHRAHASTVGVTRFIPGYAGLLVLKEVQKITKTRDQPVSPSIAIFGGAKISTKLHVLENFIGKVDTIVVGGGMANTFLKAGGLEVGQSLVEEEMLNIAKSMLTQAKETGITFLIPQDVRISKSFDEPWLENNVAKIVDTDQVPENAMILDIGPKTEIAIVEKIQKAETIIWNGPMGVFEKEFYREGTMNVARAITQRRTNTVIGGGETAYAMNMLDSEIPDSIHISTGGGASLELMAGKKLPGIECLTGELMK